MAHCLTRSPAPCRPSSLPTRRSAVAAAAAVAGALAAAPALAQTSPPAPTSVVAAPTDVQQIVVSARKRLERLQDVPLAITAITSKTLEDAGVTNILDVAKLTPGLTINSAGAESGVNITIRGLPDLSGGAGDPNVAVFIDGVYQANRSAISLGMIDIERVEVIKGPVSALYGRNAYAGVLNYVTKKPFDYVEGSVTAGLSQYGGRTLKGSIGGPIQPGVLALRLTVAHDQSDGSYTDAVNGLHAGGYKKDDAILTGTLTPNKETSLAGSVYYGHDFFDNPPLAYMDNNCGPVNKTGVNANVLGPGLGAYTMLCGQMNPTQHPVEVAALNPTTGASGNKRNVFAGTLRGNYDFGFMDGSAILGYNKVTEQRYADFTGHRDGIPFITAPNPPGTIYNLKEYFGSDNNNSDKSLELRLATKQSQALRASAGIYWFVGSSGATTLIGADGSSLPAGTTLPAGSTGSLFLTPDGSFSKSNFTLTNFTDRLVSPFASVEYDFIPALTGLLEVRNTRETKSYDIVRNAFIANTDHPYGAAGTGSVNFNFSNYRTSARYKLSGDAMAYVSLADGTKAGGINQRATTVAELQFKPETNTTLEFGTKGSFFDRKLSLGVALFFVKAKDVQISGPSDDPANVGLVTKNLATVNTKGIDFDFALVPVTGVTISGGIGLSDPKMGSGTYDYSNAATCLTIASCAPRVTTVSSPQGNKTVIDLNGYQAPRASKVTASLGLQYDGSLSPTIGWFGRVDYRYESKQYSAPHHFNYWGARNVVNLNAGIRTANYKFTAYVRNATNDKTPDAATPNGLINGGVTPWVAYLPAQRTAGVTASFEF